jgi:hypothetical protein
VTSTVRGSTIYIFDQCYSSDQIKEGGIGGGAYKYVQDFSRET